MTCNPSYRYFFTLEYDGSEFGGWQRQTGRVTVQQCFEEALYALTKERVSSFASGRTDKGVHACGQVVHVDLSRDYMLDTLRRGTNFFLKNTNLVVVDVRPVSLACHARFSALRRTYRYRLLNRASPSPLREKTVWWIPQHLDIQKMQTAAQFFLGAHYFSAFRGKFCQSGRIWKTIDQVMLEPREDEVHFTVASRSFLQHQVRIMVGTLVQVGLGKKAPDWVKFLLESAPDDAKERCMAGPTAPAKGLCFMQVAYAEEEIISTT